MFCIEFNVFHHIVGELLLIIINFGGTLNNLSNSHKIGFLAFKS
jgi:hypothetical protein